MGALFSYYFKNECEGFKHLNPRGRRPSGFIVFEHLEGNLVKPEARVVEITSPTKKIRLN